MNKQWTNLIRQAFMPSHVFAKQQLEITGARRMLASVFEENVSYEEYCKTMDEWIENNTPSFGGDEAERSRHIAAQKERVRNLESFFNI